MTDDLGWGDPEFNGGWIPTPNLNAMASSGLKFTRFYSASAVCSPTRASCLTGRNPFRVGVPTANSGRLGVEETPLSEVLDGVGYATGHFGKWHLGTLTTLRNDSNRGRPGNTGVYSAPWQHGYDTCFVTEAKVPTHHPMRRALNGLPLPTSFSDGNYYGTAYWIPPLDPEDWATAGEGFAVDVTDNMEGDDSRVLMDRVIPFIEHAVASEQPFFSVVWFHTPHKPVVDPDAVAGVDSSVAYAKAVQNMDEQVGRLRATLVALGVAENTMFWFCSDNGPENGVGSAGELRARKRSLHEGGIRVPALLEWPSRIQGGRTTDYVASTSDYYPTVVDYLELTVPDQKPLDGSSLMQLIDEDVAAREDSVGFLYQSQQAWIGQRYKLISKNDGQSYELYDLASDPRESINVAASNLEIRNAMVEELQTWMTAVENDTEVPEPPPDCVSPPVGLVNWWRAEGDAEGTIEGTSGELLGGVSFELAQVGRGFVFDGSNAAVRLPASSDLDVGAGEGMTVELWISPRDLVSAQPLVVWSGHEGTPGVSLWISANESVSMSSASGPDRASEPNEPANGRGLALGLSHNPNGIPGPPPGGPSANPSDPKRTGNPYIGMPAGISEGALYADLVDVAGVSHPVSTGSGLISAEGFQHVALTYDAATGEAVLYLNGVQVVEMNLGSLTLNTVSDLYFGSRPSGALAGSSFSGMLDEIALYDRALAAQELKSIYESSFVGKCIPPPRPVAIVRHPQSQTVVQGETVTFSVEVEGTGPFGYRWRRNGRTILPFTMDASALTLSDVQPVDAGSYSVVVTNAAGPPGRLSQSAALTILPATEHTLTMLARGQRRGEVSLAGASGDLKIGGFTLTAEQGGSAAVQVTNTFTNGVLTLERAPAFPPAWSPARNWFTSGRATNVTMDLEAEAGLFRAVAVDLTPGEPQGQPGFTNLIHSYGLLTTVAGAGGLPNNGVNKWQPEFEGAQATTVLLSRPHVAMADLAGNVYIVDKFGHSIRKVRPNGVLTTVAGTNGPGFTTDSATPGTNAPLNQPNGLWVQPDGTLYILDLANSKVRKLDTDGLLSTLFTDPSGFGAGRGLWVSPDESLVYYAAGTEVRRWSRFGGIDVVAAGFFELGYLVVDPFGFLVVTDRDGHLVYRIQPDGSRATIAGNGSTIGGGDGQLATATGLEEVRTIWFLPSGAFFVGTHRGSQVWYVDTAGFIHLFLHGDRDRVHAGDGSWFYDPTEARVSEVRSITMDYEGNLLITEHDSGYVRKVRFLRHLHRN